MLIVARSFKSAPAQKAESALLAITNARVGPWPCSADIEWMWSDKLSSICVDRAFRASGRFRRSTRTCPEPVAGTCCGLITASSELVLVLNLEVMIRNWNWTGVCER